MNIINSAYEAGQVCWKYFLLGPKQAYDFATFAGKNISFFSESLSHFPETALQTITRKMQHSEYCFPLRLTDDGLQQLESLITPVSINIKCSVSDDTICMKMFDATKGLLDLGCVARDQFGSILQEFTQETVTKKTFSLIAQGHQLVIDAASYLPTPVVIGGSISLAALSTAYCIKKVNHTENITRAFVWGTAAHLSAIICVSQFKNL